ncbi:MAG: transcriptional coactivator p15/PC4 family protein [Candidatus Aminicenantales bacterium]
MMPSIKTISEFNKNPAELIRLTLTEFKGKRYLSIWTFYDASKTETPDWRPSKKGLCLSVDLLGELKEAIDKVAACVEDGDRGVNKDSAARNSREGRAEGSADE